MKKYVIIVAGGSGQRMHTEVPKQFLIVKGKPILMSTMEAFARYDSSVEIIVVLPQCQFDYWEKLCASYSFSVKHRLIAGGETRFHSVRNGLTLVGEMDSLVAVHDGVRPFVSNETIDLAYKVAEKWETAVPVIDSMDSVRELLGGSNGSVAKVRSLIKLVQTPQVFSTTLLKKAYAQEFRDDFTDDASVVEAYGHPVMLTQGNRENIKITTPFDLKVAEVI